MKKIILIFAISNLFVAVNLKADMPSGHEGSESSDYTNDKVTFTGVKRNWTYNIDFNTGHSHYKKATDLDKTKLVEFNIPIGAEAFRACGKSPIVGIAQVCYSEDIKPNKSYTVDYGAIKEKRDINDRLIGYTNLKIKETATE